ncbi:unnamed protein product [Clavelina lepadiformis]|uniref:Metallo-beta-lactamase domain-containing protein n=1 Tax=Clavelina lepadiformis TaxID=159417 RepID=A0ABP0GQP8_CLALP
MSSVKNPLILRQLFHKETSTYTYLLACGNTKEAVLIDPVLDCVERDLKLLQELGVHLVYGMNTHVHADHITGTGKLKEALPDCKSVLGSKSGARADVYVAQDENVKFGNLALECRSTPGHTNGCTTYVLHEHEMAFTGDALLIRGCGRTDFQQGSPSVLFESVHSQIFSLPKHYKLYPAHDYKGVIFHIILLLLFLSMWHFFFPGFSVTTVEEELAHNTRLTKTKEEFIKIMDNLNLPYPKRLDESLPANLMCGVTDPVPS